MPRRTASGVAEGLVPLGPKLGEFRKGGRCLKSWGTSHLFSLILVNKAFFSLREMGVEMTPLDSSSMSLSSAPVCVLVKTVMETAWGWG